MKPQKCCPEKKKERRKQDQKNKKMNLHLNYFHGRLGSLRRSLFTTKVFIMTVVIGDPRKQTNCHNASNTVQT